MSKSHETEANSVDSAETIHEAHAEAVTPNAEAAKPCDDTMTKVVTVGVVGVVAALWEAALIPGMIIGVGAMLVPAALPKLAETAQPMFRWAVRGAYSAGQKARHAFAEAQEQVHDIVAEADAVRPPAV